MPTALRETGRGGLAATPTGKELEKNIRRSVSCTWNTICNLVYLL
ncbi:hypothetical protein PO124_01010 [Bacillus licheniformis]|nr:hypothetical protein [Bacillus licheniformis]